MTIIKNIFARIWCLWGLISFAGTFLIIFLPSVLCLLWPQPKRQHYFIAIARVWMRSWLFLVACPLKVRGLENFKKGQNYIVTFNHNSFLDIPLSCPFVPGGNKTIAKDTFKKIPIFGIYYGIGGILINRKSDVSRRKGFEQMKETLQMGLHMCIYPEGTRNKTAEPLKQFYDGAFKLAESSQAPILPCLIFNTSKALPTTKTFYFLPHKLHMHFLPAIPINNQSSSVLKQQTFEVMHNYYVANNN
jgi:1-acyl-sn-glycerol-3-phosphate acyltransferase